MIRRNVLQPINNAVEVEVIEYVPRRRGLAGNLFGSAHSKELENIHHAALIENCKAALAFSAARHAAALSQIEAQVGFINPHAGARCGAIADAYTIEVIKLIKDGEKL